MTKAKLIKWVRAEAGDDNTVLLADGFEAVFVGLGWQFTLPLAVYDRDKCIKILMDRDKMAEDEAEEFFNFNVLGAYAGKQTPVFLVKPS